MFKGQKEAKGLSTDRASQEMYQNYAFSDMAAVEQSCGAKRQAVGAFDAVKVAEVLGAFPAYVVREPNTANPDQAYTHKTYWYFDESGVLLGAVAVFNFSDGRVEGIWWNRYGNRPKIFDLFACPSGYLPG